MHNLINLSKQLQKDEEGAALIEYTVLLGILLIAVITTIGLVGTWINGKWHALQGQLS
jgi:pilus assembly protein Flp/PilA